MKRLLGPLLGALSVAALALPGIAQGNFLEGYLAESSAVTTTSCTEVTGSSYGRQPIAFLDARGSTGVVVNRVPYSFGNGTGGSVAGHAVYDAPSGGNLLLVIPLASTFSPSPADQGDVGALSITVANLAIAVPATYSATYAAGATVWATSCKRPWW